MAEPIQLDGTGNTPELPQKINIDAPSSGPISLDTAGGIGNIFTQSQAKKEDSKLISSVILQKEVPQKAKSILGSAPAFEKSIEKGKEARMRNRLRLLKSIFVMLFLGSISAALYFYTQLSPDFKLLGVNTTQHLAVVNQNLRKAQTLVNANRYLTAQLKLNELSYEADLFLSNVAKLNDPNTLESDKSAINNFLEESKTALPQLVLDIRSLLTKDLTVPTFRIESEPEQTAEQTLQAAHADLRATLNDERKKIDLNAATSDITLNNKLIDNAIKLVGNTALTNKLQSLSTDAFTKQLDDYSKSPDQQKLKALQDLIGGVLTLTKSDLATIADIKQSRVDWSRVIGLIEDQTRYVNPTFGLPNAYDNQGRIILYTGYEFDTSSNRIVISGMSKTNDGLNFTAISTLIDQLEASQYFQDVEMRSFSKSKSGETSGGGYVANFKIDLNLETGPSSKDKPLDLSNKTLPDASNGTSRVTDTTHASAPLAGETQQNSTGAPLSGNSVPAPAVMAAPSTNSTPAGSSAPVSSTSSTSPTTVSPLSAAAPAPSASAPPVVIKK